MSLCIEYRLFSSLVFCSMSELHLSRGSHQSRSFQMETSVGILPFAWLGRILLSTPPPIPLCFPLSTITSTICFSLINSTFCFFFPFIFFPHEVESIKEYCVLCAMAFSLPIPPRRLHTFLLLKVNCRHFPVTCLPSC